MACESGRSDRFIRSREMIATNLPTAPKWSGDGGVPDDGGGERARAVDRPVQCDRGQQAAAAAAQPGEDDTGDRGGGHCQRDARDLTDDAAAEESGQAAIVG